MQTVLALSAQFQAKMNALLLALAGGQREAIWAFLGIAFAYGFLHAVGPGHGKAVISSYLLARDETLKRGLWLSFASSLTQAFSAFLFVGIFYLFFGFGVKRVLNTLYWLEITTALLLIVMGGVMVWRKMQHAQTCRHLPPAEQLNLKATWREEAMLVLSIGIRPCTGAVFLLSFALMKGLVFYGAMAVLVVASGTFCAIALLACLAVYMKKLAVHFAQAGGTTGINWLFWAEILAALLLMLLGGLMLIGYTTFESNSFLRRF